jgi:putative tricarboxylic transport membrane protein
LILGPNLELQFRRALQISAGDYGTLVASPLSKILYLTLFLVIVGPTVAKLRRKLKAKSSN